MAGNVPTFKAIQVAADNDRFGGELLFLNGRFDWKVSAKETKRKLNFAFPQTLLALADEVIE